MNHLDKEVLKTLKEKLEKERETLINELSTVARQDPENPDNWQPINNSDDNLKSADPNERADRMEDYEASNAVTSDLEVRLLHVNSALENIKTESYGICTECGMEIPQGRLEANPAASTCIEHTK